MAFQKPKPRLFILVGWPGNFLISLLLKPWVKIFPCTIKYLLTSVWLCGQGEIFLKTWTYEIQTRGKDELVTIDLRSYDIWPMHDRKIFRETCAVDVNRAMSVAASTP